MKYLQKLGKALMLPVSCMPICALLMGIGYLLCPAAMQGGEVTGTGAGIGFFLIRAGGALIDNIAWLFAIGVGIGMSEDNDGCGALAALVSWLVITTLLNTETISTLIPSAAEGDDRILAFSKINNPFIGILSGIIGSICYNKFHKTKLPDWLSFFSGKRSVAIFAGLFSIAVSGVLLVIWPLAFSGLSALGRGIETLGPAGAGLYAFLNRLLIPFGLHHALNNVFWFDTIGLGDLSHFWAGQTSADVTWSLGMYMSGFFPCMMFGVPAAALAMIRSAKPARRKAAVGILLSSAVCSFVCGVTEPFEFSFMFLSPLLYAAYAALYGIVTFVTVITGFRAGFCFSGGVTDLIFSASMPAAAKTWLILPLGAGAFLLFYAVFRFAIPRWNLKTPGREEESTAAPVIPESTGSGGGKYAAMAAVILRGLGGAGNILSVDNCVTRLRLEIADMGKVDDSVIRSSGAAGVIRPGKNALQIVIGTSVQFVADELKQLWHTPATAAETAAEIPEDAGEAGNADSGEAVSRETEEKTAGMLLPAEGKLYLMKEIPDPVFSEGIMGECIGIMPENGVIRAPVSGAVTTVAATRHAVSLQGEDGKEILIHAGLDTVKLNGEGFKVFVQEGDQVQQGQRIMEADIRLIREKGFNPIIIVARIED